MKKIAVITGASSGLGYEFACLAAADGYDLVLIARRKKSLVELKNKLQKQYQIAALVISVDLSHPNSLQIIAGQLSTAKIVPDLLINNAGFGGRGDFWKAPIEEDLSMINVNIVALTHLTRLLLPAMIRRGSGRILNTASTAAYLPGPYMAVYYASKAFVLSFSEALFHELKGTGVTVTAVCPGPTRTDFKNRSRLSQTLLFNERSMMSASEVARIGYQAARGGRRVVVTGARNKFVALFVQLMPRRISARLALHLNKIKE